MKQAKDENFPVGLLIGRKLKPVVKAYYQAARTADDIADNPDLSSREKIHLLDETERAFYGKNKEKKFAAAAQLGKIFVKENLDASLFTDLLKAFRQDAANQPLEIWEQLINYCAYSAAPVGRFLLAIHDENPSTYLPAATLCAVLQISNHIQDLKKDCQTMQRFYIPKKMMDKYGVVYEDFCRNEMTPSLKALRAEIVTELRSMMKDAAQLPRLIKNKRLRMETGVILSLTNSMLEKLEKEDVLSTSVRLSRPDWLKAFGYGIKTLVRAR